MKEEVLNTYTVEIEGLFYALGAGLFMNLIYSLESSAIAPVPHDSGCKGRNAAIRSVCHGYENSRDAFRLARRSGNYVGQLWTGDHSPTMEV